MRNFLKYVKLLWKNRTNLDFLSIIDNYSGSEKEVNEDVSLYKIPKEHIDVLVNYKNYVILATNSDEPTREDVNYFASIDNIAVENASKEFLKEDIISKLGEEYGNKLDEYDYDLAMAYKEIDYQIARAESSEAELEYYRAANDPNGVPSPQLLNMWRRLQETKKKLEQFNN